MKIQFELLCNLHFGLNQFITVITFYWHKLSRSPAGCSVGFLSEFTVASIRFNFLWQTEEATVISLKKSTTTYWTLRKPVLKESYHCDKPIESKVKRTDSSKNKQMNLSTIYQYFPMTVRG